jgi:uncharacterized protein (TIGR00369 family)
MMRLDNAFLESLGVTLRGWTDTRVTMSVDTQPRMLNRSGRVHGGVLCTLLDSAAGYAGLLDTEGRLRSSVTLSLSTQFLDGAPGQQLEAIGLLERKGRNIYFASARVVLDGHLTLATASGVFKYTDTRNAPALDAVEETPSIAQIAAAAHLYLP